MADDLDMPAPRGPEDVNLPRDTRRSLPMALLRARETVMARFRPMLAENDINEQQWRVLRVLDQPRGVPRLHGTSHHDTRRGRD